MGEIFPDSFKSAVIRLLLKKPNIVSEVLSDGWLMLHLPFMSKILEKVYFEDPVSLKYNYHKIFWHWQTEIHAASKCKCIKLTHSQTNGCNGCNGCFDWVHSETLNQHGDERRILLISQTYSVMKCNYVAQIDRSTVLIV